LQNWIQTRLTGIFVLVFICFSIFLLAHVLQALSDPYCQSTCLCVQSVSTTLMLNISETKRLMG